MARSSTYLNFEGLTEAAFAFYRSVFGTEYVGPLLRMRDVPASPDAPQLTEAEQALVLHVQLPITGGHLLMGSDIPESMGPRLLRGNQISINLEPDTRAEAERLFQALAEGGTVTMPLQDMFWGALFGSVIDRYGVPWMVNCDAAP